MSNPISEKIKNRRIKQKLFGRLLIAPFGSKFRKPLPTHEKKTGIMAEVDGVQLKESTRIEAHHIEQLLPLG